MGKDCVKQAARITRRCVLRIALLGTALGLAGAFATAHAGARTIGQKERETLKQRVTDETGRTVLVPADVHRIVSLAPNMTEVLYALGVEDRLVGDTTYCDYPAAAKNVALHSERVPITSQDLERMHGNDERVPIASLESGLRMITNLLIEVAGK